jgi:hypothetical protein
LLTLVNNAMCINNWFHPMRIRNGRAIKIPNVIGVRTDELGPLLRLWAKDDDNRGRSWSHLLRLGLKKQLSPYAGKRYAHLIK